jgi:hypothetical protein
MSVSFPEGVVAQGNELVTYVPTLTDPEAPTVDELTGAGAVNLSCYLRGFEPNAEQAVVQDIRLCSKETFETPGRVTNTINDLVYVYDPQDAGAETPGSGNLAYHALAEGTTGYLVVRRGLDAQEVAYAADQVVDVYPVHMGAQRRVPVDPTSEGSKFETTQKAFITGPVHKDKKVAAGG